MRLGYNDPLCPQAGMRLDLWVSPDGRMLPRAPQEPWGVSLRDVDPFREGERIYRRFRFDVPIGDRAQEISLPTLARTVVMAYWEFLYPGLPHPEPGTEKAAFVRLREWEGGLTSQEFQHLIQCGVP